MSPYTHHCGDDDNSAQGEMISQNGRPGMILSGHSLVLQVSSFIPPLYKPGARKEKYTNKIVHDINKQRKLTKQFKIAHTWRTGKKHTNDTNW